MNYLDVKWRAKIIWAYLTLFWLCLLDEGTDVYEAYKHFMNDDPIFGSLTVGFMFLPAIMYSIVTAINTYLSKGKSESCKIFLGNFWRQLPVLNIWQNYKMLQTIKVNEQLIAGYYKRAETAKTKSIQHKFEAIAQLHSRKLEEMKSEHQIFQGYQAVFESGFQYILQFMVAFKDNEDKGITALAKVNPWVWVSTSLSFMSMSATFTSLLLELPIQVKTEVHTLLRGLPQLLKLLVPMTIALACN